MEKDFSSEAHLPIKQKNHKSLKLFFILLLILIALGGVGYSIYSWLQNQSQSSSLSGKDQQIESLNNQITKLKSQEMATISSQTGQNLVAIRELGITIALPDSIKDLTYSYTPISNENGKFETAQFSTKTLADKYANTSDSTDECTSYGIAPPLGALTRWSGTYDKATTHSTLAKQLDGFYITFDSPQAPCMTNVQTNSPNPTYTQLKAFQDSFSSIKKL